MKPLSDTQIEEIAERFKALSDPTRLSILHHLMKGEAAVGEIAEGVAQSQPNVSRHLAGLKQARFVKGTRQGQSIRYSIADDSVYQLCAIMCGQNT
ncbi:ArsR/SmtB family transcription factor [Persicirhabdus sediminis]|uniref:Winged helix-turn-helix transcriptional regulator n=1 Tax=Persicirhabdus sediminis TaxID=454144 RepID=A0A8J7MDF6_9BACT|nr:metalloregulator ArsR/SmtB family transcription factor [Persicirhabdus sediminis]MBK1790468.1 winged helix-turn-helix transcriptional regulator [Persicirhabdus sediminis]